MRVYCTPLERKRLDTTRWAMAKELPWDQKYVLLALAQIVPFGEWHPNIPIKRLAKITSLPVDYVTYAITSLNLSGHLLFHHLQTEDGVVLRCQLADPQIFADMFRGKAGEEDA